MLMNPELTNIDIHKEVIKCLYWFLRINAAKEQTN